MSQTTKTSTGVDKYLSRIGQNLIEALNLTMTAVESYRTWRDEAKAEGADNSAKVYEELLQASEKGLESLRGLIQAYVECNRWEPDQEDQGTGCGPGCGPETCQ